MGNMSRPRKASFSRPGAIDEAETGVAKHLGRQLEGPDQGVPSFGRPAQPVLAHDAPS